MSAYARGRRLLPAVVGCAVLGCGSAADGVRLPEFEFTAPLTAIPAPVPGGISPENDGFGFAHAVDLRVRDGGLAVLENGNARLVVFDSAFRAVRAIGREGAGPGELRGVFSLGLTAAGYGIAEINNARISIFDTSGVFRRAVPAPGEAAFAFGPGDVLYVATGSPDHYLERVDTANLRRPFGDRPVHLYPVGVQRERVLPGVGGELVTVGRDGRVFVFDRVLAGILTFDADGRRTGIHVLPARLREDLVERQRAVYADFGDRRPVHHVAVSDLTITDAGDLLLLFPAVESVFGLLVDPDAGSAREIRWAPGSRQALEAQGGGTGVVFRGRFYRALGDEVTIYVLRPAS